MNSNSRIISTDEDPSLRIESSAIINLRGVSTKLNKYKDNLLHGVILSRILENLPKFSTLIVCIYNITILQFVKLVCTIFVVLYGLSGIQYA